MKNSELVRMGAKKPPGRFSMPPPLLQMQWGTPFSSLSVALGTLLCSKEVRCMCSALLLQAVRWELKHHALLPSSRCLLIFMLTVRDWRISAGPYADVGEALMVQQHWWRISLHYIHMFRYPWAATSPPEIFSIKGIFHKSHAHGWCMHVFTEGDMSTFCFCSSYSGGQCPCVRKGIIFIYLFLDGA